MDENRSKFSNQTVAEYSKIHVKYKLKESEISLLTKAEYDRIFKIIPSCARFRENYENRCLVVK